jgi:hypothetical protein
MLGAAARHPARDSTGMRILALLVAVALLAACSGSSADDARAEQRTPAELGLTDDALLARLRAGGLTLLLRHTETTGPGVDPLDSLGDCAAQRELSEAGREDARGIGAAMAELGIPVGEVRASPFCRTIETAELAFGRHVEDEALLALASFPEDERPPVAEAAAARYAVVPEDGTVTVLIGQRSNIQPVTGATPDEGETVVLEPDGEGFTVLGTLPEGFWQALAASQGG